MEKRSLIEEKNESSVNGGEKHDQNQPILEEKLPIIVDPVSDRELIYKKTLELCRSHSNLEDDDDDFEDEEDEMVTESFFNSKSNESNRRVEFNSIEEAIISKVFKK